MRAVLDEVAKPLRRDRLALPLEPVRMVHLGLGAFHRAHQAWFVHRANRLGGFGGVAAFTVRRPDAALALAAQDGLYHVLTASRDGFSAELVESISAVHPGSDLSGWRSRMADPEVGIASLTVTEAGYFLDAEGCPDLDHPALRADRARLAAGDAPETAPARLVTGLEARWRAGSPGMTVLSCDNLAANGDAIGKLVAGLAEAHSPGLAEWIRREVRFPNSVVDRITPRPVAATAALVRSMTGFADRCAVVSESFSEWTVERNGEGLPASWRAAGVREVDHVAPYEQRKLRILNGAHLGLAYLGEARGRRTIAEAVEDAFCLEWLSAWWDEACEGLPFSPRELLDYRSSVLERFSNRGIEHTVEQIGMDGSKKIPMRVREVVATHRARGTLPEAAALLLAGWAVSLRRGGAAVRDENESLVAAFRSGELALPGLLVRVLPALEADPEMVALVEQLTGKVGKA